MDFSVLMSVYKNDDPNFFEEALNSISTNQSFKPKQVVIVEDGPVNSIIDDVIEKVKIKNKKIEFTILSKKKNEGLASALNDGINLCKYDWIARMDSDDISVDDRFEKQINYILSNDNVDVLGGAIEEFNSIPGDLKSKRVVALDNDGIKAKAKRRTPMNHVSVMYKKDTVKSVGGYSVSFGKLEDYKLWVDLINSNYTLNNLEDVLVNVRVGNGFLARRSNKREIKDWDMLQKYLLKNGIVNKFEAFANKIYIRGFIYMPGWLKKLAYKTVLRRN